MEQCSHVATVKVAGWGMDDKMYVLNLLKCHSVLAIELLLQLQQLIIHF